MTTNRIQTIITLMDSADIVVLNKDCPHTSESERLSIGQKLAVNMFTVGVTKRLSPSEIAVVPPHRIKEVKVKSF